MAGNTIPLKGSHSMQITLPRPGAKWRRAAPLVLLAALGLVLFWSPVSQVAGLALGGAVLAFLIAPLAKAYERRFNRPLAALAGVLTVCLSIGLLVWLMLPTVIRELGQLAESLPQSIEQLSAWLKGAAVRLQRRFPGIEIPMPKLDGLMDLLPGIATGTMAFADGISRFSMMLMLCYFFLCDRDALLLRAELLVPLRYRAEVVRTCRALSRELRLYLQGQLTISGAVAALAAVGLWLIGARSALVLGGIVGILNMVPYFGPFIGGVPAVLIALGDGWEKAALCVGVLALVQQADAALLSPRIMGSLTGFSPAAVLLAIYAGAVFGGIAGMLAALPVLMTLRTALRVFMTREG